MSNTLSFGTSVKFTQNICCSKISFIENEKEVKYESSELKFSIMCYNTYSIPMHCHRCEIVYNMIDI